MDRINKLGKTSELIGKFMFYSIIIIIFVAGIVMSLSRLEDKPGMLTTILVFVGTFIVIGLFYFVIRALFRPIFNLNKNIALKIHNQITEKEFKKEWFKSLICSLIFGLLFIIGTFGISLLIMIPHYFLLIKSKGI